MTANDAGVSAARNHDGTRVRKFEVIMWMNKSGLVTFPFTLIVIGEKGHDVGKGARSRVGTRTESGNAL